MVLYRKLYFVSLVLILINTTICFSQMPNGKVLLDNDWRFHFGNASNPEKDFNYGIKTIFSKSGSASGTAISSSFNDSTWRHLNLPHDWAVELPFSKVDNFDVESHGYKPIGGLFPETSIGWYRKHFTVAKADSGYRFQLQFDGIFRDANIWLNGFYVGNNKSGYVGGEYDITDYINYAGDNVLVVRVDATQYEGWFYEGAGIYRHVWLNKYAATHIATNGVFAYSTLTDNKAIISIETTIDNENNLASPVSIHCYVTDRKGSTVSEAAEKMLVVNALGTTTNKQLVVVKNPTVWSIENPYLYRVIVELKQDGKVIDRKVMRYGIRTVEIKTNGVFINGKYVKILGTNNHQDHAGIGSALPDYMQYYRISLLKNMGSNAYRTSHHAPTPELLDACDSLGMLVLDEQRLLNSSPECITQFEKLVKRDRSRTCVFMWSIGNEEGWIQTNSFGKRIAQTFIDKLKQLDPTRTCTYAADLPNVFTGINEVIPVRGFNYREYAVADYHKDHPDQPLIGTEMGSTVTTRGVVEKDTVRGYLPDQDITAPWWASKAETWWKLAAPNNYWLGGFVWTGFDYRGEPTPFKWPNINSHFGIMDVCGFPKNLYYYYQSWWTDKDVLHISPHWNHTVEWGKPAKEIEVWVNTNADNVELYLNGKSLGKKDMPRYGHLNWQVPYQPGKLEAIAYKKGKRLTAKIETTGQAAEVVLTPYKTTLLADGRDVSVINISAVDKEGREVPDADNMIHFTIEGEGKIIGVGNGDPSSHEADKCMEGMWQRSLFNGKCQVIVQSTKQSGNIKLVATSTGLWSGSTDIITVSTDKLNIFSTDNTFELKGEAAKPRSVSKMVGADISFLPELEDKGMKFSDKGIQKDAIEILKDHGFNYVRLRLFNNPSIDSGYSPTKGFCDLQHTLAMAKRVKASGMKLLLDFHYSDYWADPGKQYKPAEWKSLSFLNLRKALYDFTQKAMYALKAQGTLPDMVQVGNEINHGIVWPDGSVTNMDGTAQLLKAGIAGVKSVDPSVAIMLHVALGGQNDETVFFVDNMLSRGVQFDVIGESFYPKWHGTPDDLRDNLTDLVHRYNKDIIVVEYSALKDEVNKIVFDLPNGKGKGTFIWEPLNTWEKVFDDNGKANDLLQKYDEISRLYLGTK